MKYKQWIYFTFINLLIVALLGLILRYKMTYSFPIFNQKFLLHGHSHFALTGWVTQVLMVYISNTISKKISDTHFKKYQWILYSNIVASYGMLFSFPIQGYASISILFSSFAILISIIFMYRVFSDISNICDHCPILKWFKAATLFSTLSCIGVAWVVYLMITNNNNINYNFGAIYLFLHLQYNGWFIFSCFGLFINRLHDKGLYHKDWTTFFWVSLFCCIPTYFLSIPWLSFGLSLYIIFALSAFLQLVSWGVILWRRKKQILLLLQEMIFIPKFLFVLVSIAYSIKVILQLLFTVPSWSQMAFGYRSIVIGYLHLVFLGIITQFILSYAFAWVLPNVTKLCHIGVYIFVAGVVLSELAIMIQSLFALNYKVVPFINESLLIITLAMFLGVLLMNIGIHYKKTNPLSRN